MILRVYGILLVLMLLPAFSFAGSDDVHLTDSTAIAEEDSIVVSRAFDYFYHQALFLKEQECFDEAFLMFKHCLELQPSSSAVSCELYFMYSFLGLKDEAKKLVEKAVENNPDNYWYYELLASVYEYNGEKQKAKETFERITERFPEHREVLYKLAMMYADDAEYNNAICALDKLERIEGKNEEVTSQKFRIYRLMNNKEAAINELMELVNENPEMPSLKVFLGDVYMDFGDTLLAYNTLNEVLKVDPEHYSAQFTLAEFYRKTGNDSLFTLTMEKLFMNDRFTGEMRLSSLVHYIGYKEQKDSIEYNMRFLKRLMNLPFEEAVNSEVYANYLVSKGVGEDSVSPVLKRLLQYEPENSYAHMQLLNYSIKRNAIDEIIARCDTAILYLPELLELYYYRGLAYYKKERYSDAVSSLSKGLETRGEDYDDGFISDIYALIGDAYHTLGNLDACIQAYDSALVYNSENISVYNNYAYFLTLAGRDLERAEEMSYRTIKAEPENTVYIDTYMWVLFALERYDEAKAYAEKLISIEPELGVVELHHCGDIFAKSGDIERAVNFWTRAKEKGDDSKVLKRKIKRRKYIPNEKKR